MSTRIEIELTSASPDGSWTWRAAGARQPRGVLDGTILPGGASVGDQLKVEAEQDIDGIRVLSVVANKDKAGRRDLLELLPTSDKFEPVIQQRAERDDRDDRDDRGRRGPRRDRDGDRGDRRPDRRREDRPRGDAPRDGDARPRPDRGERPGGVRGGGDQPGGDRPGGGRPGERPGGDRRGGRPPRPHFTPPPEIPQRPKPKRLRPGKQHRTDVLTSLPEEQRPVAELALQGLAAVRQRLREDNARLKADGKPEMPEAAVMRMAEELLPRLRVADWLDRADAAKRQLEHLDLRDLRSVVAASDDPSVTRDESTREIVAELKSALVTKQDEELALWLGDVEAALDVGRIVRALRLSSQPPKAGVPFPGALAARLGEAAASSLQPTDAPDRWIAVLEAVAFSPVRSQVVPAAAAEQRSDELLATVKRLGPLLPQVAALFEVEVPANAHVPKPLRQAPRKQPAKMAPKPAPKPRAERTPAPPAPPAPPAAPRPVDETAAADEMATVDDAPGAVVEPDNASAPYSDEQPTTNAASESAPRSTAAVPPAAEVTTTDETSTADDTPSADEAAAVEAPMFDDAPDGETQPAPDDTPSTDEPAAAEDTPAADAPAASTAISGDPPEGDAVDHAIPTRDEMAPGDATDR